jgi:hypothetical protein
MASRKDTERERNNRELRPSRDSGGGSDAMEKTAGSGQRVRNQLEERGSSSLVSGTFPSPALDAATEPGPRT